MLLSVSTVPVPPPIIYPQIPLYYTVVLQKISKPKQTTNLSCLLALASLLVFVTQTDQRNLANEMEDLSDLGGRGHLGAATSRRPAPPSLPSSSSSKVSVQVYTVPSSSAAGGGGEAAARAQGGVAPLIHASSSVGGHGGRVADLLDPIKAKIVSHPRYHRLLAAFLDCHKARAPIDRCPRLHSRPVAVLRRLHVCSPYYSGRLPAGSGRGDRGGGEGARGVAARSRGRRAQYKAGPGARPVHGGVPNMHACMLACTHDRPLVLVVPVPAGIMHA